MEAGSALWLVQKQLPYSGARNLLRSRTEPYKTQGAGESEPVIGGQGRDHVGSTVQIQAAVWAQVLRLGMRPCRDPRCGLGLWGQPCAVGILVTFLSLDKKVRSTCTLEEGGLGWLTSSFHGPLAARQKQRGRGA